MANPIHAVTAGAPSPLGVTLANDGVNVAVVSQSAAAVWFCLFEGEAEIARLALPGRTGDVFHGFVAGVREGARYGLRADGPFQPQLGHRFDPSMLLVDPYATELDRPFVYDARLGLPRAEASDTAELMPKAIVRRTLPSVRRSPKRAPGVIYEVPVKAFTMRHPGVPAKLRGTIAGLAAPAVIEHLIRIGVDTIELMPLAAWIDERHLAKLGLANAWGYNPVTMLAPDPRLAPGGMAEVRATLAALHDAGFRVLLDVVLNHTGEGDDLGPTLSLRGLDNALYYRHATDDPSRMINDTGCGNTLALDRSAVMQLALDALRHWSRAGFDGFRFDLAPVLGRLPGGFSPHAPLLTAIAQDTELSGGVLIAEPWDVGPGGYQLGAFPAPWGEWNDRYRDDVREFWRGDPGVVGKFATRIAGSSDIFDQGGRGPSHSVNFIAAHDGFTLADLTSYAAKHNAANGEQNRDGTDRNLSWNCGTEGPTADPAVLADRRRDVRAMLATLMVSRGTPMLTAGDEFGRTQKGNNNAYAQDNAITWLNWVAADEAMIGLVGRLVALRGRHRALTADQFLTGDDVAGGGLKDAAWLRSDGQPMLPEDWGQPLADVLGLTLFVSDGPQSDSDRVVLWFNRTYQPVQVSMPAARPSKHWQREADSSQDLLESASLADDRPELAARSVVVFSEI